MTRTSLQRLRLVRLCVNVQCTLGIAAGLLGAAVAIFCAATATDDPEDWSGIFIAIGAYAAVIGFGLSALLLVLARRVEHPAARRGLVAVEALLVAGVLSRQPLLLSPSPSSLFVLGLVVPAVIVIGELLAVEAVREQR